MDHNRSELERRVKVLSYNHSFHSNWYLVFGILNSSSNWYQILVLVVLVSTYRHCDGHLRFGYRVHGRANQRRPQGNGLRQWGAQIDRLGDEIYVAG